MASLFPNGPKSAAPGVIQREGWTVDNVVSAADMNALDEEIRAVRFNVNHFSANGDGATSDVTPFSNAQDGAGTTVPAVLFSPAATYAFTGNGVIPKMANGSIFRGEGMHASVWKSISGITNFLAQTSASFPRQNLVFEDLCFDSNALGTGIFAAYGEHVQGLTFRRCRFLLRGKLGIYLQGVVGVTIEDCEFHGSALAGSQAISITGGSRDVVIRRNKFRYCESGIVVDTGSTRVEIADSTEHLTIEDNDFDMGWWLWPSVLSGSGGTVTYSGDAGASPPTGTLTSSGGGINSAAGIAQYNTFRVLEVVITETIASVGQLYLAGAAATWNTAKRGEIIRSGTKFAVIVGKAGEGAGVRHEGWLDTTTYLPVAPPSVGASYTHYKTIHGRIDTWNDTSITTYDGFWDADGASVVPANGTLFELYKRSNYNIHVEYAGANVKVRGNTVRRGWSDQVSIYCNRADIDGNLVEDGNDMGITLNGTADVGRSRVTNNTVRHQGACGIFIGLTDNTLVQGNVCERNTWCNHTNVYTMAGIQIVGAEDVLVDGNVCDGGGRTLSRAGIAIHSEVGQENDSIILSNNQATGSVAGIVIYGAENTNIRLRNNKASISYQDSATGVDSGILYHGDLSVVGTPEGAVTAGPGTQFVASTGAQYFKASGTGDTGWVVLSGANTGDVTFATVGSSPTAAGASASGQVITLQPASATHGGVLSNTTQSIAGAKTFTGAVTVGSTLDSTASLIVPNAGNPSASTTYNGRIRNYVLARVVNFGTFTAAATTENVLLFQVPAKTKLLSIYCDTTIGFTGLGATYDLILGTSAGGNQLVVSHSVLAPVTKGLADADLGTSITRAGAIQGGLMPSLAAWDIYGQLASDANLGNGSATLLTAGSFTIYMEFVSFG